MLKEILNALFENIHELGHGGTEVDQMMDAIAGMGHRIKWGHDLEGMINALDMDGIPGVVDWLQHMALDFTSEDGIPLPFAEAIRVISGMEMDEAIDWLCINAADVAEMGMEAGLLALFKNNEKAYKTAVAAGIALGIVDDNPLLLAMNAVIILKVLREKGVRFHRFSGVATVIKEGRKLFDKIAIGAAALDFIVGIFGGDLAGILSGISYPDGLDVIAEGAGAVGDIIDGFASLGIGIIAGKAVNWFFDNALKERRERIAKKRAVNSVVTSIKEHLKAGTPLERWGHLLYALEGTKYFPNQLGF